ncbi:MAG: phosphoribosylformylglycinamidine synthase subunit PurL [Sphaerochaetaceae bacterium]
MDGTKTFDIMKLNDDELKSLMDELKTGLTVSEARNLHQRILGRAPTLAELVLFGIQGSEHSSYKSSRPYLKLFHTDGEDVIIGAKEDAGIIRITKDNEGNGYGIVMSHESHNHPSQIVPYEGAATGVGGNIRDVCCMGGTVVALANDLRFGELSDGHNRWLLDQVVAGLGGYANPCGIPTVAGGLQFDQDYSGNTLVTAVTLGAIREADIIHSYAPANANGYDLILVGKPTDNSGFGGASFSSFSLSEDQPELNKGAVQEPNAFLGRHLMHATEHLIAILREKNLIDKVACKDLGAGGIACATVEIADGGNYGCFVNLDLVPVADSEIEDYVILCSETQERYLWAVPKEITPLILDHFNNTFALGEIAYNAKATVIGYITDEQNYVVVAKNKTLVNAKAYEVTKGFLYNRPLGELKKRTFTEPPKERDVNIKEMWFSILDDENVASREVVYEQFDKQAQGLVVFETGVADVGIFKAFSDLEYPPEIRNVGVTLTCDQNPRYNKIDAYQGAALAVLASFTNTVVTGATCVALSDCLCYGNPENPDSMREFEQGCRGVADTAKELGIPIIAGNVSLYNESNGITIPPSPMISVLGKLDDVSYAIPMGFKKENSIILLIGERKEECGGSIYYNKLGYLGNSIPNPDKQELLRASKVLNKLAKEKMILSSHDISEGGLAVTLSEMAFVNNIGANLEKSPSLRDDYYLFSESLGFVLEVEPNNLERVENAFKEGDVVCYRIGQTTKDKAISYDSTSIDLLKAKEIWQNGLRDKLI